MFIKMQSFRGAKNKYKNNNNNSLPYIIITTKIKNSFEHMNIKQTSLATFPQL